MAGWMGSNNRSLEGRGRDKVGMIDSWWERKDREKKLVRRHEGRKEEVMDEEKMAGQKEGRT